MMQSTHLAIIPNKGTLCKYKIIEEVAETYLKKDRETPCLKNVPRGGRVDLVITCTFTDRWVASSLLYRFQLPAAECGREACEPQADPASRITKCGLKKDLSQTPQGA